MEGKAEYKVVVPPGRRQRRKQIEEKLRIIVVDVWQDRPNTAVKVTATWQGRGFTAYGFTKVQWPDQWDPDKGVELATQKAIAKITKTIVRQYVGKGA